MRPRSLSIAGLTSFSDSVEVSFDDVALFALVGPTGAGKSSVIDAMTLALYGRIPRLKASEIAPVISLAASECTVGLEFAVRGVPHRAVRTIRRTTGRGGRITGATTVEAVLERLTDDGDTAVVLAGSADDMTAEVERLLGLSFDEFTRAVVLPQGEFARVLSAQAAERQKLLARLLGTGIYDRLKYTAGQHARAAQERAEQTAHQIAQLGDVTATHVGEAEQRVQALTALVATLKDDAEALVAIRDRFREADQRAAAAEQRLARLAALEPPPEDVLRLADAVGRAEDAVAKTTASLERAELRVEAAEESLPDPAVMEDLRDLLARHERTATLREAVEEAALTLPARQQDVGPLAAAVGAADAAVAVAQEALARQHREHAALAAVAGLAEGDACPVCAASLPADAPALLAAAAQEGAAEAEDAQQVLTEAITAAGTARARHDRAVEAVAAAEQELARRRETLTDHLAALRDRPDAEAAQARIDALRAQQVEVAELREEVRRARGEAQAAQRDRAELSERASAHAARLDRLRLGVAELGPPDHTGDVPSGWAALHDWAQSLLPALRDAAAAARADVAEVQAEGVAMRGRMDAAVEAAGVPAGDGDPRDRAVQARADAVARRDHLQKVLEMSQRLRSEEADAREQAVVGAELARLLRSDQFQQWLLDEATRGLVHGASTVLLELSNGRYQLRLDGRNAIQVVDLASAGAVRSIRTLSGGETFLASLALALSLAEQIAVSATGPVALESLFIDEGFGALDTETLDMAATAIENLGAGDRLVGVVTHVPEMADRLPTRYEVRRGASSSTVERVDA